MPLTKPLSGRRGPWLKLEAQSSRIRHTKLHKPLNLQDQTQTHGLSTRHLMTASQDPNVQLANVLSVFHWPCREVIANGRTCERSELVQCERRVRALKTECFNVSTSLTLSKRQSTQSIRTSNKFHTHRLSQHPAHHAQHMSRRPFSLPTRKSLNN